jgi:hypothetical protein
MQKIKASFQKGRRRGSFSANNAHVTPAEQSKNLLLSIFEQPSLEAGMGSMERSQKSWFLCPE